MKIAVRMDDITPEMDWDKFYTFYQMLKDKGIFPLLGVVPKNRDENLNIDHNVSEEIFWARIRELQEEGCIIAMHGYNHIYTTTKGGLFPLNRFSEFAGVDYKEQKRQLELGKQIFQENGIETDFFMAPAHTYDGNTLRALKACGFCRITDGFGLRPYIYKQLTYYPIAFKQSSSLNRKKGFTTFVAHSNTMTEQDFQRWNTMLNQSKGAEWISYRELLNIEPIRQNLLGRGMERTLAIIKHILVKL